MSGDRSLRIEDNGVVEKWKVDLGEGICSLRVSRSGDFLAALSFDGLASVIEADGGRVLWSESAHRAGGADLDWCTGDSLVATVGLDGSVRWWNAGTGREAGTAAGGETWGTRAVTSPDGRMLATAFGRRVRIWDDERRLSQESTERPSTVTDIAWSSDSKFLFAGHYGGVTRLSSSGAGAPKSFDWKGSVLTVAPSPDGRVLATGEQDGTVHIRMLKSGEDAEMTGFDNKVRELVWHPSSKWLACGGSRAVAVWNCSGSGPMGRRPRGLQWHAETLTALSYHSSGKWLASGSADGGLAVWSEAGDDRLKRVLQGKSAVCALAWHPSRFRVFASTQRGSVACVDVQ